MSRTQSYRYRGLPCRNLSGEHATHYVSGRDILSKSGGILEWCYSAEDAAYTLESMHGYPHQFKNLKAEEWK